MKTVMEATKVELHGVGEVAQATMPPSAKMFNFFAKQIYANMEVAIWRELVANAIDGQKENGNTTPVRVTLPSMLDPIASVRDFGCSMGHEFMMTKFMAFGDATTKENSDEMIGGFGIGSKSPLSYTEQYSVKCFLDGVLRIYSIFKDATGFPSIAFLSETPTIEPDGVEVSFPVRQDDIENFNSVVVNTLQYFDPLPELKNTELTLEPIKYDTEGKNWGMSLGRGKSQVIMGGIAYPLDCSEMTWSQKEKFDSLYNFATFGVDVYLSIGEANIALSREHITHDDALYAKLNAIMEDIGEEFGAQVSKTFENCSGLWEATQKYGEALSKEGYSSPKRKVLEKYAKFDGKKLTRQSIPRPDVDEFPIQAILWGQFGYGDNVRYMPTSQALAPKFRSWDSSGSFEPKAIDMIVLDDAKTKPMLRVRTVVEDNPDSKILFLRDNSENKDLDWAELLKALGDPPKSLITKLSTYSPQVVVQNGVPVPTRPFKAYIQQTEPSSWTSHSGTLPADGGLYIQMDNFAPESTPDDITMAKLMLPHNVAWLNKTDYKAVKSKLDADPLWFSVEEAIALVKSDYRAKNKRLQWAEAWYQWSLISQESFAEDLREWGQYDRFPTRGALFQLKALQDEFKDVTDTGNSNIRTKLLGVKFDAQLNKIRDLAAKAKENHPFIFELETMGSYTTRSLSKGFWNNCF